MRKQLLNAIDAYRQRLLWSLVGLCHPAAALAGVAGAFAGETFLTRGALPKPLPNGNGFGHCKELIFPGELA